MNGPSSLLVALIVVTCLTLLRKWLGWMAGRAGGLKQMAYLRLRAPWQAMSLLIALGIAVSGLPGARSAAALVVLNGFLKALVMVAVVETSFVAFTTYQEMIPSRHTAARHSWAELVRALLYLTVAYELVRLTASLDGKMLVLASTLLSLGLGAALKPALQNLVSGILMRLSKPFQVGHLIAIGDDAGVVDTLDWRSVSMLLIDGNRMTISNSKISGGIVVNYCQPSPRRHYQIPLNFEPWCPPGQVRQALIQALAQDGGEGAEVFLSELGRGSHRYELNFWIPTPFCMPELEVIIKSQLIYALRRQGWLSDGRTEVFRMPSEVPQNTEETRI